MMVPFDEPQNAVEEKFNVAHKKTRNTIDRAIGVLKSRFRCLCRQSGGAINFDVELVCTIIMSCIVIHNNCTNHNISFIMAEDVEQEIREEGLIQEEVARARKNRPILWN